MELSRRRMREKVVERFDYLRTCALARELCLLVRTHRAVLDPEDVKRMCTFIAGLCKEAGCEEPSSLCLKAAEAALRDEEEHLKLCAQSCQLCGESRRPKPSREQRAYVA